MRIGTGEHTWHRQIVTHIVIVGKLATWKPGDNRLIRTCSYWQQCNGRSGLQLQLVQVASNLAATLVRVCSKSRSKCQYLIDHLHKPKHKLAQAQVLNSALFNLPREPNSRTWLALEPDGKLLYAAELTWCITIVYHTKSFQAALNRFMFDTLNLSCQILPSFHVRVPVTEHMRFWLSMYTLTTAGGGNIKLWQKKLTWRSRKRWQN